MPEDGSEQRFRALHHATAPDILTYLLRRTATAEDAADCLADTFLIAWNKRATIPPDVADARPWLFGVARNVMRRGQERDARARDAASALAAEIQRLGQPPLGADLDHAVSTALASLPAIDREIVTLMSWEGLSPRDIAQVLDLSPNVVRVRAHRARTKLRQLLSPTTQELKH
jgi:RNA polymerase sigma factor (sigma-70 family)